MNICIIVKRVPDTEAKIKIKAGASDRIDESEISFIINPYDEFAIEEALKISEERNGETTVITAGPKESDETLRQALAMGVDNAVHIMDNGDSDPFRTACLISKVARDRKFDLIFCGRQAIDDDMGAVGSMVAEFLGYPQVLVATRIDLSPDGKKAFCRRDIEGGSMIVETPIPAVFSCQKGLNDPRLPTIIDIKRATKKAVETVEAEPCPEAGKTLRARVDSFRMPPARPVGKVLRGDPGAAAKDLARLLREEAKVI